MCPRTSQRTRTSKIFFCSGLSRSRIRPAYTRSYRRAKSSRSLHPEDGAALVQTLKIRLSDSLLASIREVLCLRSVSIEHYFVELAEVDTAPIRLQKLRSNFLLPSGVKAKTIEKTDDDIWRTKVRPEQVQRILFLSESEKMSPPE